MEDIRHELHVLVSMAKIDASLNKSKTDLEEIPTKRKSTERGIAEIDAAAKSNDERLAAMQKERRVIETKLDDNAELIKTKKTQLMGVKTNKEYSAILKEIEILEQDIDQKEERLLILMDEMEEQEKLMTSNAEQIKKSRGELEQALNELSRREEQLTAEIKDLKAQKPALLKELDPQMRKRYDRLLAKLGDFAVTHVVNEICQGCFARIPPQTANEVKMNDRIITCSSCGRMLVHYEP